MATLGEFTFGRGQSANSLIFFTIGTGIGGGVIIDRKLRLGAFSAAGELGHQTLLPDGPERLEALIALIEGARESLRVLYYIWSDDVAGRRVRDALVAAAARGIAVSLLVDGFGASSAP